MNRIAYTPADFEWVNWTPEIIKQKTQEAIEAKKSRYAEIKAIAPEARTFENTIIAIESSDYAHQDDIQRLELLMSVSASAETRTAAQEALEEVQKAMVDIEYDIEMYHAVLAYEDKKEPLEGPDKKLFDDMLRDYKRMGFDLEPAHRQQLKDNLKELAELSTGFEKTIAEHKDHIIVRHEELAGMTEAYINGLKKDEEGNCIVGLAYPEYIPFMERCDSAPRRKELMDKFLRKGGVANIERLKRILELRSENAKLLGYPNHAAYALEIKMAKTVEAVNAFNKNLLDHVMGPARLDLQMLSEMKKNDFGDTAAKLAYYDISYYIQKDKLQGYAVDDEVIREYFPLDTVKTGMFDLYATVLGLSFKRATDLPTWHDAVEWYAVTNTDGTLVGYFALDLFPREGKFGHAACFTAAQGRAGKNGYVAPMVAVVANFNAPSAELPSLLNHDEVQTLFHEFGHAMHSLATTVKYASQSGTSTARDFVEAPSQMFEYWAWEKDTLKKMSRHHRTGEALPDEIIDNMIRSKNHMQGYAIMRQLLWGAFDMTLHVTDGPIDPVKTYADLYQRMVGLQIAPDQLVPAGFGHLMDYAAGYYGYLWAEAYAADMFARFRAEGVVDPKIGMEYRKKILEVGSSREEIDSVKDFLGREPNNKAFLQDMGLATRDEKGEEAAG